MKCWTKLEKGEKSSFCFFRGNIETGELSILLEIIFFAGTFPLWDTTANFKSCGFLRPQINGLGLVIKSGEILLGLLLYLVNKDITRDHNIISMNM